MRHEVTWVLTLRGSWNTKPWWSPIWHLCPYLNKKRDRKCWLSIAMEKVPIVVNKTHTLGRRSSSFSSSCTSTESFVSCRFVLGIGNPPPPVDPSPRWSIYDEMTSSSVDTRRTIRVAEDFVRDKLTLWKAWAWFSKRNGTARTKDVDEKSLFMIRSGSIYLC